MKDATRRQRPPAFTGQSLRTWLLLGLVATLLGAATGIGYFTFGAIFGPLSDATAVVIGLSLIPVALGLHGLFRPSEADLSRLTRLIGVGGLSLLALGSIVLVLFNAGFDWLPRLLGLPAQFLGIFIQGLWLALVGGGSSHFEPECSAAGWAGRR